MYTIVEDLNSENGHFNVLYATHMPKKEGEVST